MPKLEGTDAGGTYFGGPLQSGDGVILPTASTTPTTSTVFKMYMDSSNDLYWWDGSTAIKLNTTGGSGGAGDLDDAYSNGQTINIDQGAMALTDSTAAAVDSFTITKDGAGSGDVFSLSLDAAVTGRAIALDMNLGIAAEAIFIDAGAGARTASDILVTDDSTGNHSVIDINSSGAGVTVGYDFTGSYNGNGGGQAMLITLDANDNLTTEVMQVTTGAGLRGVMFDLNFGHTDSATSSHIFDIDLSAIIDSNVFDVAYGAASTGNTINIDLDNAVAGTALHIEGSGVRTQPFIELASDSTGASNYIDVNISGAGSGNVFDITTSTTFTGNAHFINLDSAVAATALHIEGSGIRTQPYIELITDSTSSAPLIDISVDGATTGTAAIAIDMNAGLASAALFLDAGNGIRTADVIDCTFDGSGNVAFLDLNVTNTGSGDLIDIDVTGNHTGNAVDITYATGVATGEAVAIAMGTNVAGSALSITAAGSRTDDLIKIADSSTTNSSLFDINLTGAYTTSVAFDLNASGAHTTGLMKLLSNSSDSGTRNLLDVINDNTAATGTTILNLQQDAVTETNFKKVLDIAGFTIFTSDGTTAEGALTGVVGDLCLNGGTGNGQLAFCDANGTNWTNM